MCLLVVLRDMVPDWPLLVAANRDERYDRPSEPPQLLCGEPPVFGGRDLRAGGTWLAVNHRGMVCAIANRSQEALASGELRSRGLLCLDAARQPSPIAVADMLAQAMVEHSYAGFNLVCATTSGAGAFYFDGHLREKPLGRGAFVVTTGDANDRSSPKVKRALEILDADSHRSVRGWLGQFEAVCRDHGGRTGGENTLCMHGDEGGTVSSMILAFHATDPQQHIIRFCPGRPCEQPYASLDWPKGFFTPASVAAASPKP